MTLGLNYCLIIIRPFYLHGILVLAWEQTG
jgi:hypothetical protein